jgi:mono/diheme cytochrome c family protein
MKPQGYETNRLRKGGEAEMKRKIILCATFIITLSTLTFGISAWATEDVRTTKHNLITNPNIGATGTGEVCVFCHTPHGGSTDVAGGLAPLWNRTLPTGVTYTVYTSPNFDSEGTTAGTPKGVSLACLSCHDGTVAFDSLLNFPGSGSVDNINFSPTNSPANVDPTTGKMINKGTSEFPMLGTNLSNDHPISMKIPVADPQFDEIRTNLDTARLTAGKVAYLYRGTDAAVLPTDPRDRIRAYPTMGNGDAYIECASCHNPHEATSPRFLRYPSASTAEKTAAGLAVPGSETDRNKGSLVCLTCHQK